LLSCLCQRHSFQKHIRGKMNVRSHTRSYFSIRDSPSTMLGVNKFTTRLLRTSDVRSQRDYYKILGLKRGVSAGEIKKAYYQLAKQYHPDTNKEKGAAERFQEIQEAYEVLSNERKRADYDQYGTSDFSGAGGGGAKGARNQSGDPFDEIFKEFFGGGRGTAGGFPGFEHIQNEMKRTQAYYHEISFMDAVKGGQSKIRVQVPTTCTRCNGNKAEPGTSIKRCPDCNGTGTQTMFHGFVHMNTMCQQCHGRGTYIPNACQGCRGKGIVMKDRTFPVDIPAGVEDGQRIQLQGIQHGEVHIVLKVAESKIFSRNGADVSTDIQISFAQAILGGNISISGLYGDIDLPIKPGTQSHQQMRLIGKGITRLNGYGKGDHFVNIKIQLPKYLTTRQKELIVEFAELDQSISGTVNGVTRGKVRTEEKESPNFDSDSAYKSRQGESGMKGGKHSNEEDVNKSEQKQSVPLKIDLKSSFVTALSVLSGSIMLMWFTERFVLSGKGDTQPSLSNTKTPYTTSLDDEPDR